MIVLKLKSTLSLFLVLTFSLACGDAKFSSNGSDDSGDDGKKVVINEGDVYTGNIDGLVDGLYDNKNWNEIFIKVRGSKVTATYNYREGRLIGNYNAGNGMITATWYERDCKGGKNSGQAEFKFKKVNGEPKILGRWNHVVEPNRWFNDWDLTRIGTDLPKELDRFDRLGCP